MRRRQRALETVVLGVANEQVTGHGRLPVGQFDHYEGLAGFGARGFEAYPAARAFANSDRSGTRGGDPGQVACRRLLQKSVEIGPQFGIPLQCPLQFGIFRVLGPCGVGIQSADRNFAQTRLLAARPGKVVQFREDVEQPLRQVAVFVVGQLVALGHIAAP
jgi:hypothetical protein